MASKKRIPDAIETLVQVFHEYASKDCKEGKGKACGKDACMDHFKLSKREFKQLVQKEFDIDKAKDPAEVSKMMRALDEDGDGQLDFKEFVALVVDVACEINEATEFCNIS